MDNIKEIQWIEINGQQKPTVNHHGRPIHSTLEGIQNFWKWFGDSKTIDPHGRPIVFYRGQPANYNDTALLDKYYTTDNEYASTYCDPYCDHDDGGNVLPVYIIATNIKFFEDEDEVTDWDFYPERDRLIAENFDAVATRDCSIFFPFDVTLNKDEALSDQYDDTPFLTDNPDQQKQHCRIKSAIGDNGDFSLDNYSYIFDNATERFFNWLLEEDKANRYSMT